jgi:hypothetical protein
VRSDVEFALKIGVVLEEADESLFWLEVLLEREAGDSALRRPLLSEADELTAIFAASTITARATAAGESPYHHLCVHTICAPPWRSQGDRP